MDEVVIKYNLFYDVQPVIGEIDNTIVLPLHLSELIEFNLNETIYDTSEAAICESIIYPILQEVWKHFKDKLQIWSHTSIQADDTLTGILDYIIAQKSTFGRILGRPLIATIEAKKDNFSEGWVQCTAQLVAMQKINQSEQKDYTLYGIVTNGEQWEFGQLRHNILLKNTKSFSVFNLQELYAVLYTLLNNCHKQID